VRRLATARDGRCYYICLVTDFIGHKQGQTEENALSR
jgi:hypothetical protein